MSDEFELLRRLRPPTAGPDPALVADERKALMALITEAPRPLPQPIPPDGDRRRRRRPRWLAPTVLVISGATVAAGWAVFRPESRTLTSVSCGDSTIGSSTGDPVADCAALWRREKGTEPPALVAYEGPGGGIWVLPVGEKPPAGSKPLGQAFRQETSIIELEDELGDVARGLQSACRTEADARRLVTTQLERLGLAGWRVTVRAAEPEIPRRSDRVPAAQPASTTPTGEALGFSPTASSDPATEPCPSGQPAFRGIIRADQKKVELAPRPDGPFSEAVPFVQLARSLSRQLIDGADARCLSPEEALAVARHEAARLGLEENAREIVFHIVPPSDPAAATCARPTTGVGGRVEVTLRAAPR